MTYVLATTGPKVKWYVFDDAMGVTNNTFELSDVLDLKRIPRFSAKGEAKKAALRLGLQTWRYVRF